MYYEYIESMISSKGFTKSELPIVYISEKNNESVIVDYKEYEGGPAYVLTTIQKNGMRRINVYHSDGRCEETYEV